MERCIWTGQFKKELTEEEIASRLAHLAEFEPKVKTGYLRYYAEKVCSASTGAVFSR